jgi:hypothetical protein
MDNFTFFQFFRIFCQFSKTLFVLEKMQLLFCKVSLSCCINLCVLKDAWLLFVFVQSLVNLITKYPVSPPP